MNIPYRNEVIELLEANKIKMVSARRANDDESAKMLSQEKETLKGWLAARCFDCGVRLGRNGRQLRKMKRYCRTHDPRRSSVKAFKIKIT